MLPRRPAARKAVVGGYRPIVTPTLTTDRLLLRPPEGRDAPSIAELAADRRIADTTATVPHPYALADAERFIARANLDHAGWVWVIVRRPDDRVVGVVSFQWPDDGAAAELGYWVGVPHWGQGFATEAASAAVGQAFAALPLEVVHADHLTRNPASHRVMEKLGMRHEGVRRVRFRKWGILEDLCGHSILRSEWSAIRSNGP